MFENLHPLVNILLLSLMASLGTGLGGLVAVGQGAGDFLLADDAFDLLDELFEAEAFEISAQAGNWPAPFGISLVLDRLSAMLLVLTASLALPALGAAIAGDDRRVRLPRLSRHTITLPDGQTVRVSATSSEHWLNRASVCDVYFHNLEIAAVDALDTLDRCGQGNCLITCRLCTYFARQADHMLFGDHVDLQALGQTVGQQH